MSDYYANITVQAACNVIILLAGISIGRHVERRKAVPVMMALFRALVDARTDLGDTQSIDDLISDIERKAQSND